MAAQRRRPLQGKQASPNERDVASSSKKSVEKPQTAVVGGRSRRSLLAAAALSVGLASALCEWPIYMVYEKDLRRPAIAFSLNLSITAIIALAVSASPQVRAFRAASNAAATPSGPSATGATEPQPLTKKAKRQMLAAFVIILVALYYGFGLWGPSGAVTAAALVCFLYLTLP